MTLISGAPVYARALGAFDCRIEETIERKGCVILVGAVEAATFRSDGDPLVLFRNRQGTFAG